MSVELHVGSTYAGKVVTAEEALQAVTHAPDIHVTTHNTTGRTGAPPQPMSHHDLKVGAWTRVLDTAAQMLATREQVPPHTVIAAAECGVVFDFKKLGFVSRTVAAIAVFDGRGNVTVAGGEAGGVRYPTRDVVRAWLSKGQRTVGEVMRDRLGRGDPQDPHAILGKGHRADQVRSAYMDALDHLGATKSVEAIGNKVT